jgi:hypothetical protein
VVTKGDQYDVREKGGDNDVRNLGKPVELASRWEGGYCLRQAGRRGWGGGEVGAVGWRGGVGARSSNGKGGGRRVGLQRVCQGVASCRLGSTRPWSCPRPQVL